MSDPTTFQRLQALARSVSARQGCRAPTQEYVTRHVLESFLARLAQSRYADDFVLKGGILLAAYGARRPTKDVDANALRVDVTGEGLAVVVREVIAIDLSDGVEFAAEAMVVQEIREQSQYPGLRVRVPARVQPWAGTLVWDVSTGDPIVPPPRRVDLDRLLGEPITLWGYAPETALAEKAVTILERGISSTRWRDYVDIVALGEQGFDADALLRSARAVAVHRGVALAPIAPVLIGYGATAQAKWAAWRRKEQLEDVCAADLDDQVARVVALLDPVFGRVDQ